jgi:putative sterol carrier protein
VLVFKERRDKRGPEETAMTYDEILKRFSDANVTVPGKKVKFDFGDTGKIHLDGVAGKVSATDDPADTTIKVKLEDFVDMAGGKLDPTAAFMQGKLRVEGDMGVAMQLQSVMAKLR